MFKDVLIHVYTASELFEQYTMYHETEHSTFFFIQQSSFFKYRLRCRTKHCQIFIHNTFSYFAL